MKKWGRQKPVRFDERELKTDLGENNFIFIGSSCDLFAADIPEAWIVKTLEKANQYNNQYFVQSKNPGRFEKFIKFMDPVKYTLCATIETNYSFKQMGTAPDPEQRSNAMARLPEEYRKMITVEPIMKFDLKTLSYLILVCNPTQVNIGADTGGNHLPEPSPEKISALVEALRPFTEVRLKANLGRLYKEAT
jgi:hypothetical protein